MSATKDRALVRPYRRKGVMVPEPEIRKLTISEIQEQIPDPYLGQHSRYGKGKADVDALWKPEELALEIHDSPQATMLAKVNIECWTDADGKIRLAGGNRTVLALGILKTRYGSEDITVTIETETPEGKPVKLNHIKNYGVAFPVKFYGELTPDQVVELETRDNRAVKKASEADFYFKGWNILKTTNISVQPSKEKRLVRHIGVSDFNEQFPARTGLNKKTGEPNKPCVSVDTATGEITINGRENVETFFRLFRLPDFAAMAFIDGLAGRGPKITKRAVVKLADEWDNDREACKGKVPLNNSMSREQVEKAFAGLPVKHVKDPVTGVMNDVQPASSLLSNLKAATTSKARGGKKIVPWSGGEMKKYQEGLLASTTSLPILMQIARREPGFASSAVVTALCKYVTAAERALGADAPEAKELFDTIKNQGKPATEEESDSEEDSEDEENIDPETGEPLDD